MTSNLASIREEQRIRRLRDLVFDKPTTDDGWNGCRENWMKPIEIKWLEEQAEKIAVSINLARA